MNRGWFMYILVALVSLTSVASLKFPSLYKYIVHRTIQLQTFPQIGLNITFAILSTSTINLHLLFFFSGIFFIRANVLIVDWFEGRCSCPAHSSALCNVSPTTVITPLNISKLSLASVNTFQPVSSSRVIPLATPFSLGGLCDGVLAAAHLDGKERM